MTAIMFKKTDLKGSTTPRWKWWVFAWVTVLDALVIILSLGYYQVNWRAQVLFSDWLE